MGTSEVRPTRTSTRTLREHGSGSGGNESTQIRTYKRKGKEILVGEEDSEDEGFKVVDDYEDLMNMYSD